jgi:hypothetical protein
MKNTEGSEHNEEDEYTPLEASEMNKLGYELLKSAPRDL